MDRKKHIGIIDSILLCTLVIGLFFIISKMCVENNNDYDNTEDIEQTDTIFCYDDIQHFVQLMCEGNKQEVASLVQYPIHLLPLKDICSNDEFIANWDILFDDSLINMLRLSGPQDWVCMDPGINFNNGELWFDYNTEQKLRLITVNYDTPLRKKLNDYLWNLVSLML